MVERRRAPGAGTGSTLSERARERNGNLRPAARFLRISRRTPSTGCALRSGGVDCRALPPNPENAVQHTPFHVRNDPPPATVHLGPAPSSSPGPAFARSSRNCVTLRETKPLREASVRDGLRGGAGDGGAAVPESGIGASSSSGVRGPFRGRRGTGVALHAPERSATLPKRGAERNGNLRAFSVSG